MNRRHVLATTLSLAAMAPFPTMAAGSASKNIGKNTGDTDAVKRVEDYLNSIKTLSARFLQVDAAGNVANGKLYLRRPGRLRFEYDPPSPLLIVADGFWLILHDREIDQVNRFPLYKTPLGVLVDDPVNLREKVEVVEVEQGLGVLRVRIIDRDMPDEGWISITFTEPPMLLRQWKIRDAQGGTTALSLTDIRINQSLDPKLFFFVDPPPFSERQNQP
ncbi:MAG: outer membrane lipoprotein carrier protein LolA [Alphaproteobacteria bacterium]